MKALLVLMTVTVSLSLCNLAEKLSGNKNDNTNVNRSGAGATEKGGLPPADRPQPTAAQTAALAGGKSVTWEQQGITWMLPPNWSEMSGNSSTQFNWKSPGTWDAAFILPTISNMGADFPTDVSIKAMYDQAVTRQKNGEVVEVRWLELDGVTGVQFLEAPPENKENPRRLQWQAYRKYAGQNQLLNLILSSQGQHFDKHKDALHAVLYSTKLIHE